MPYNSYTINYHINNPKLDSQERPVTVEASPEQIEHLVEQGYVVIENLFSDEQIRSMQDALEEIAAKEKHYTDPNYLDGKKEGQYLRWLIDKHAAFKKLFECTLTRSIAQSVLGPQVHFENIDARISDPTLSGQVIPWHIHLRVVPNPLPPFFCYPHALHCLLYLDDVSPNKGQLCILPKSHKQIHYELDSNDSSDKPGQLAISVKAGTCVIMHGNLWHKTLPSEANAGTRRLLVFSYAPAWLKSDQTGGVKPAQCFADNLLATEHDPLLRELAGEFYWS